MGVRAVPSLPLDAELDSAVTFCRPVTLRPRARREALIKQRAKAMVAAYRGASSTSPLAVCFTDRELQIVFDAARPLPVDRRDEFLREVANALRRAHASELGEGAIYRIARDVQARFFDPPDLDGRMPRVSKWER